MTRLRIALASSDNAGIFSQLYKRQNGDPSHIHDITDLEALPRDTLEGGDCVCMQEFVPIAARGHQKPWPLDLVKVILDPSGHGDLPGKGSNGKATGILRLPAGLVRIITTNKRLSLWHNLVPNNLFTMSPDELAALSDDARAILKRVIFWEVSDYIFAASAMAAFRGTRTQSSAAAFDRVFAGSNAIL